MQEGRSYNASHILLRRLDATRSWFAAVSTTAIEKTTVGFSSLCSCGSEVGACAFLSRDGSTSQATAGEAAADRTDRLSFPMATLVVVVADAEAIATSLVVAASAVAFLLLRCLRSFA